MACLAIPLEEKVDNVASDIEGFVLKVVASAGLEVRVRSITSGETIALTSSHIAQELAFSSWLCVRYPDALGPLFDRDGRARPGHKTECNQTGNLHTNFSFYQISYRLANSSNNEKSQTCSRPGGSFNPMSRWSISNSNFVAPGVDLPSNAHGEWTGS
jgi:hypothetical protein